ncbi:MAG TPA: hydrogenase maturation protease [Dissulfurispiraceae bacterium]|nr:hydrogenase maturation protease [Dissulfurispiraceae bacterium]
MKNMGKTIVIGLGNPLKTDDGFGLHVARTLGKALAGRSDVDVTEAFCGGIALVETMCGYDEAIVVDAMPKKAGTTGTILTFAPCAETATRNSGSLHDAPLCDALAACSSLGEAVPPKVICWGVVPKDIESFGEALTDEIAAVVAVVAGQIMDHLNAQS